MYLVPEQRKLQSVKESIAEAVVEGTDQGAIQRRLKTDHSPETSLLSLSIEKGGRIDFQGHPGRPLRWLCR